MRQDCSHDSFLLVIDRIDVAKVRLLLKQANLDPSDQNSGLELYI